jgi:hypothetical protein
MNNVFPEEYLDIIPGHGNDKQKERSRENTQENIPVLDQKGKNKIESIKIDQA